MNHSTQRDYPEFDLIKIARVLWKKAWLILLSAVIAGGLFLSCAAFFVTPRYKATAMMYVNNTSSAAGSSSSSISSGDLAAAKKLLDIYLIILQSRTALEQVIEVADLDYTYEQLSKMVDASSVNDTEVFRITATCSDPMEAKRIVDTIVELLPGRIAEIVDGSSVRVVDHAGVPVVKASPDYVRYTIVGALIGAVVSSLAVLLRDSTYVPDKDNEPSRPA